MGNMHECLRTNNCDQCYFIQEQMAYRSTPQFSEIEQDKGANLRKLFKKKKKNINNNRGIYHYNTSPLQITQSQSIYIQQKNNQRITEVLRKGSLNNSINFLLTTQPLSKFPCENVIIFGDSLRRINRNPFIREALKQIHDQSYFLKKLEDLQKYNQFCKKGDYLHVISPFPNIQINNLIVIWVPICENPQKDYQTMKQIIQDSFYYISNLPKTNSVGVIQISYGFGYCLNDFHSNIIDILTCSNQSTKKSMKFTYWAYDKQNLNRFKQRLMSPNQPKILKSQSSKYF